MSLLPSDATYCEEIADYFLAFRGSGLALSALDAELLQHWEESGVPLDVVCRGIRKAAEARRRTARPTEASLRTLRACAKAVEDEFRRYQGLAVGRGSAPSAPISDPGQARLHKVLSALQRARRQASPALRQAIDQVLPLAGMRGAPSAIEAAARVAYLDEALALCYLRALPFAERIQVGQRVRSDVGAHVGTRNLKARRVALRAYRVLHARAHGHLPGLA